MITVQPYIKSFHVSFTPSAEYDVVYYKVHATHVDNFVNGDFTPSESNLINEGPETSLLHQVDKGGVWGVKITAVDTFGEDIPNYSGLVTCTVATLDPLDTTAPNVPVFSTLVAAEETGVASTAVTPNIFIKLAWTLTPVPEDFGTFVLAYKRHTATDWNEQLTEGYSHVFTNMIAGVQYDFKIKAVDKWNNDSAFSAVKTITAAADTVAPVAPTWVSITPSFGSVRLAWDSPADLDLKQTNVYRNTSNNSSTATKVASAYGTSYTDAGLLTGTTYYYWLKSEDYSINESEEFSSVRNAAPIQIMPIDLDITARVDFVVKDSIFQFTAGTTTLTFTNGSVIRGSAAYTITTGSVANAHNSYVVATLSGNTATISVTPMIGEFPTLNSSQVIIALTSSAPLAGTTNYACYVRQSNSMAIEGAIIRDATITTAKIKDLTADKIGTGTLAVTEYIGVNNDQIKLGNIGTGVTGILIRNPAKTADVFKVDSAGNATLKNLLIDGSITLGESKILLDGVNSRLAVSNATGSITDMVAVGKLATGNYGISVKDNAGLQVLRVDKDGAVLQNLTAGTIDADKVTINNLVVGGNVTMGPSAYIDWNNVTDTSGTRPDDGATRNVYVGAWSATYGTYVVGDNVSYNGKTYGCKIEHASNLLYPPTNTTYWQLVSDTGVSAVSGFLTNEAHTVAAYSDGTGYSLTSATGTFKLYNGTTDVTTSSAFTGTATKNGLTLTINATTGVYTLSGTGWTTDSETFTLQGTYGTTAITKVFSITKSKGGVIGPAGPVLTMVTSRQSFSYTDNVLDSGQSDITFTAVLQNITDTVTWTSSPSLVSGTGTSKTLSAATMGANKTVTVTATAGAYSDTVTVVRLDKTTPPTAYSQSTVPASPKSGDTWFYTGTSLLVSALVSGGNAIPRTGYTWNGSLWIMTTPRGTYIDANGIYTGTLTANQVNVWDSIQSAYPAYVAGVQGWKIDKYGQSEFQNIKVRGDVEATSLSADYLNIVKSGHIADLSVDTSKIADLSVDTSKIADLSVDTLKIAGNAVTIPTSVSRTTPLSISRNVWVNALSFSVTSPADSSSNPQYPVTLITGLIHLNVGMIDEWSIPSLSAGLFRNDVAIWSIPIGAANTQEVISLPVSYMDTLGFSSTVIYALKIYWTSELNNYIVAPHVIYANLTSMVVRR